MINIYVEADDPQTIAQYKAIIRRALIEHKDLSILTLPPHLIIPPEDPLVSLLDHYLHDKDEFTMLDFFRVLPPEMAVLGTVTRVITLMKARPWFKGTKTIGDAVSIYCWRRLNAVGAPSGATEGNT